MKCELCNSVRPEPEQRLCEPCIEAVARLWAIANNPSVLLNSARETVEERATSRRAPSVARTPIAALL